MSEIRPEGAQGILMPPDGGSKPAESKIPPKIEVGSYITQIKIQRGKRGRWIMANVYRPPVKTDENGNEIDEGPEYMVTNSQTTRLFDLDLGEKEIHEPDILAYLNYRGKHTFETLETLEQRARLKAVRGKLPGRRR